MIDEFHGYARVSSEKDLIVCNGKGSALMKMLFSVYSQSFFFKQVNII